jgi:uncharacterized protein (TIGR00645 family)
LDEPVVLRIQRAIEALISFSRWLIVPMLLGLVLGLGVLVYKFTVHLWEVVSYLPFSTDADVVVGVLKLADFTLVGYLILIVILSGYTNFVRRFDPKEYPEWPPWITEVDFTATKQKLLGTVVVIGVLAAIETYLNLDSLKDLSKLGWLIAFLLTIVAATIGLAIADRLSVPKD